MYVLDTNIISYLIRGSDSINKKLVSVDPSLIFITSITVSELVYGAKTHPTINNKLMEIYEEIFDSYEILDFDLNSAIQFGVDKAILKQTGQLIDDADIQIASIAKSNNMVLVTHNLKDFKRIINLDIEDWV
jgi:tRNA(fMet)-specific endonuclease VapC